MATEEEMKAAWIALDWDIRTRVPLFLRAAGLVQHAEALSGLPPINSIDSLRGLKEITKAAAVEAYQAWLAKKPPLGSSACAACRCAAVEASKMTLLPPGQAAIPIAAEVAKTDIALRADALVGTGDAEGAADWAAALIACGDFNCPESEIWERARARLHPTVLQIMMSWQALDKKDDRQETRTQTGHTPEISSSSPRSGEGASPTVHTCDEPL